MSVSIVLANFSCEFIAIDFYKLTLIEMLIVTVLQQKRLHEIVNKYMTMPKSTFYKIKPQIKRICNQLYELTCQCSIFEMDTQYN